jgi:hypothetical protein
MQYVETIPEVASLFKDADHIDVKAIESSVSLRQFIAGFFSYYPGWIEALYRVRSGLVRMLGMRRTTGVPKRHVFLPEDVPMTAGARFSFFTVQAAAEDRHWVAGASEAHLTAHLAIVAEPLDVQRTRFHAVTIVHYHNRIGPLYFNVIRPFHHLVVAAMIRAGATHYAARRDTIRL